MHVQRFSDWQQLERYRSRWNDLTENLPFRSHAWLQAWWKQYGDRYELYVLGVFDESDVLVGVAPWYREQHASSGRLLRFLGDGDVCTDYLDVLAMEGQRSKVATSIGNWLIEAQSSTDDAWDATQFENLDELSPTVGAICQELEKHSATVECIPAINTWRLTLPETWHDYEMLQSKSHRKQIRRFINRVLDTDRAQLVTCDKLETFDEAMEILIDLHMRRRNSLDQPGCFASLAFDAFLRESAASLIASGDCQIVWLNLDDVPIAAEIHFLSPEITYAYQAGIDPDRLDDEPGSLMQIAVIRQAIEQGKVAVDFMRGDEPYKAHWRAEPRKCHHIRVVANTAAGRIRHGIWTTQTQVKTWLKAGLTRAGMI